MKTKVKVIPCSGVGKVFGLMSREVALQIVDRHCQDEAETLCLSYLVTGDVEAEDCISEQPCITIDGCNKMCAAKCVGFLGGDIQDEFNILSMMKEYEGIRLGSATELSTGGWNIIDKMAEKLSERVQQIQSERG